MPLSAHKNNYLLKLIILLNKTGWLPGPANFPSVMCLNKNLSCDLGQLNTSELFMKCATSIILPTIWIYSLHLIWSYFFQVSDAKGAVQHVSLMCTILQLFQRKASQGSSVLANQMMFAQYVEKLIYYDCKLHKLWVFWIFGWLWV